MEIKVFGFEVTLMRSLPPYRLEVKSKAALCSCLPWLTHYKTIASFTLLATETSEGPCICTFPEPLTARLPHNCCGVKVLLKDSSSCTLTSLTTTPSASNCGTSCDEWTLRYEIKKVGDVGLDASVMKEDVDTGYPTCFTGESGARVSLTEEGEGAVDASNDPKCFSGERGEEITHVTHQLDSTDRLNGYQRDGDDNVVGVTQKTPAIDDNDGKEDSDRLLRELSQFLEDRFVKMRERKHETERRQLLFNLVCFFIILVMAAGMTVFLLVLRPFSFVPRILLHPNDGNKS